jgi:predicted O-linked N-acetylglucosamine transferase (SPINDLY family)
MRRFDESASCFQEALRLRPTAELYTDLAQVLILCRRFDAALEAAETAIRLNPRMALAHCHRGTVLRHGGALMAAQRAFESALAVDADCSPALEKLAAVATQLCEWEQAIACFIRVLELKPDSPAVHSALLFTLSISGSVSAGRVLEEHQRWAEMHGARLPRFRHDSAGQDAARVLRIGFVSGDFRRHPVRFFIAPILRDLDRTQFQVVCYSNCANPDSATDELRAFADEWRDIASLSDTDAAEKIRTDRIDILVDLSGHTTANRLLVLERKPAPVQVTYLGYPNTTGLSSIDYWLTDEVLHPSETSHATSERIWRLSRCWVIYEPPPNAPQPARDGPSDEVTFGSFNALQKLGGDSVRLWARVLTAIPGSKLLIKAGGLGGPAEQALLYDRFAATGVSSDRLTLMGQVPSDGEHLALYGRVDVALDTTPFSGGTTTAEALWMGVPVVTLPGELMMSRMSASMLHSAGLDGLIARDEDQFVAIAAELARDAGHRSELRQTLRSGVARSPLCDGRDLASEAGAAFRQMWTLWCAGEQQ